MPGEVGVVDTESADVAANLNSPVIAEPRSEVPLASARRTADALLVPIADPAPVEVLRVERASIEELEGILARYGSSPPVDREDGA